MGKRILTLVRHAKSSRKDPALHDRARPLNKRGHRNAAEMAQRLAQKKHHPELLISSPALRARSTAEYFAHELGLGSCDIHLDEGLYFCGVSGVLKVIRKLPDDCRSALICGHNPDMSLLAGRWLNRELALPTCSVVRLRFDCSSWNEVPLHTPALKLLESPKHNAMHLLA